MAQAGLAELNRDESTEKHLRARAERQADELGMVWILQSGAWVTPIGRSQPDR